MRLLRTTGTLLCAAFAALAASGCTFLTGVRSVSRVTVSVTPTVISINQSAYAFGTAFDGNDALQGTRYNVTFSTRNAVIATVNAVSGQVFGVGNGVTYIIGENNGKRDSAQITVRPVLAKQIVISPRTPTFRIGATNSLGVTILDSVSNQIGGRAIVWTSRTPAVLTITSTGVVTPLAVGTSWIVASVDNGPGVNAAVDSVKASVTVPPIGNVQVAPSAQTLTVGQTQQYTVSLNDSLGAVVTGRAVIWSSSNAFVASVSSTGLVTSNSVGTATITAQIDRTPGDPNSYLVQNGVGLTVLPPTAAITTVDSSAITLGLYNAPSKILRVTVKDASGQPIVGRAVLALNYDPNIVSVNFNGDYSQATIVAHAVGKTSVTFQARDANNQQNQGTPATLAVTVVQP